MRHILNINENDTTFTYLKLDVFLRGLIHSNAFYLSFYANRESLHVTIVLNLFLWNNHFCFTQQSFITLEIFIV